MRSASLWTATERIPRSRQARITRSAISPRLATSTLANTAAMVPSGRGAGPGVADRSARRRAGAAVAEQAVHHWDGLESARRLRDAAGRRPGVARRSAGTSGSWAPGSTSITVARCEGRGEPVERTGQAVADALKMLSRQLGSAVDAMGEAFHDRVVRERALQASRAFADAVEASVTDVSRRMKKARKGGAAAARPVGCRARPPAGRAR